MSAILSQNDGEGQVTGLDVAALPAHTLDTLRYLPTEPSVYFVLLRGKVLYIGASRNPRLRWRQHPIRHLVVRRGGTVACLPVSGSELRKIERLMIQHFVPPLNNHHTTLGQSVKGERFTYGYKLRIVTDLLRQQAVDSN